MEVDNNWAFDLVREVREALPVDMMLDRDKSVE